MGFNLNIYKDYISSMHMNKLGQAKEMTVLGTIASAAIFIFIGLVGLSQNTSGDKLTEGIINIVFGGLVVAGVLMLIAVIVGFLIWLLKQLQ